MKEIEYKDFSLSTHQKNWQIKRPNVCQFELTFKCGIHCKHCYSDCYNNAENRAKELNTQQVKVLLDKIYDAGVVWLCFTGGDPVTRPDFLEIYEYAKKKGFIVTIFTNCCSMTEEIADFLKKYPPFVIEFTLNAVTKELYEQISQAKGSFDKMMSGLKMVLDRKLPLKIKTQLTKDNFKEKDNIKKFIENLGLSFRPTITIYPRLNGDKTPCGLRLSPEEMLGLDGKVEKDCENEVKESGKNNGLNGQDGSSEFVFRCAVGNGDGFHIDPYGSMFVCNLIRKHKVNLLPAQMSFPQKRESNILETLEKLNKCFHGKKFTTNSECRTCSIRNMCYNCPGNAYLETGNEEAPIEYHCELVKKLVKV